MEKRTSSISPHLTDDHVEVDSASSDRDRSGGDLAAAMQLVAQHKHKPEAAAAAERTAACAEVAEDLGRDLAAASAAVVRVAAVVERATGIRRRQRRLPLKTCSETSYLVHPSVNSSNSSNNIIISSSNVLSSFDPRRSVVSPLSYFLTTVKCWYRQVRQMVSSNSGMFASSHEVCLSRRSWTQIPPSKLEVPVVGGFTIPATFPEY